MTDKQNLNSSLTRREILRHGLYGGLAAGLTPSLWLSGCGRRTRRERPNIILLSVDTLRADHLGCYGYNRNTSPNVDKFAAESVLFENCFSHAPSTGPSCSSFLSGFLPHETKVISNGKKLPLGVPTITEILKKAGYKTYGVVSNWVLRKKQGFNQGFDVYDDRMDQKELARDMSERIAENTTTCAIDMLKQHGGDKFFMWIHYQDPHGSFSPQKPYDSFFVNHGRKPLPLKFNSPSSRGKGGIPSIQRLGDHNDYHYYVAQYDGEIRYFDEHFKRLVETLKELGQYDDSLIIFTADHGEAMGEHNYFFTHGHNLDHCLLHVPLIVRYKNLSPDRRKDFVQHMDIVPTILRTTGIKIGTFYRGQDLLIQHPKPPVICSKRRASHTSVIVNGLKLVVHGRNTLLFEISKDPYEKRNLARNAAYRERLADLNKQLVRLRKEDLLGLKAAKSPQLTNGELEKLRSLGYVE